MIEIEITAQEHFATVVLLVLIDSTISLFDKSEFETSDSLSEMISLSNKISVSVGICYFIKEYSSGSDYYGYCYSTTSYSSETAAVYVYSDSSGYY